MPDGNASALDILDDIDFTIQIACECYYDLELVRDAVARQPDFKGAIALSAPCVPDSASLIEDADLVLVVADKESLALAMVRLAAYKQIKQTTLLIYLQDNEQPSSQEILGLTIPRSQLPAGITRVMQALVEPVIPQGLICVDWCDSKHVLELEGQTLIEEAFGSQPEDLMQRALGRLQAHAAGRPIQGMQVSISCSTNSLKVRLVHTLLTACKEVMGDDATLIVAAPFLDWPKFDHFEIRLFAKLGGSKQQEA